jgi:hypothetical protein
MVTKLPALVAGDTWTWDVAFDGYPASAWALAYFFRHPTLAGFTVDGSQIVAVGDVFRVTVPAATTAAIAAGDYQFAARVTHPDLRSFTVDSGAASVAPNLATAGAVESRTFNRQMRDLLRAALLASAGTDVVSYTVNGRSITRVPRAEVEKQLTKYEEKVLQEEGKATRFVGMRYDRA